MPSTRVAICHNKKLSIECSHDRSILKQVHSDMQNGHTRCASTLPPSSALMTIIFEASLNKFIQTCKTVTQDAQAHYLSLLSSGRRPKVATPFMRCRCCPATNMIKRRPLAREQCKRLPFAFSYSSYFAASVFFDLAFCFLFS